MLFQVDFIIALYTSYVFLFHSLDGIPLTSIAVSALGSSIFETKSVNKTHMNQYRTEMNSQANAREYLISSMIDLPITTINSIKLQASSLTQLTQATNQLTRYVLTMASNQSIQCAINVQTGVNSPLQKRTIILDLDLLRANQSSGGQIDVLTQNTYEQSQLADRIHNQVTKMISLNTLTLSIHLNLGQYLKMSSPQSFISLEMILIHSLEDKIISQIANAQFQLSKDITYHLSNNSMILIRVRFCRENFYLEINNFIHFL